MAQAQATTYDELKALKDALDSYANSNTSNAVNSSNLTSSSWFTPGTALGTWQTPSPPPPPPPSFSVSGTTFPNYVPPNGYGSSWGTVSFQDTDKETWPFRYYTLSKEEIDMIKDFKIRNPDFDDYDTEITLIFEQFPNMRDSTLFLALIYDLAKKIRTMIRDYVIHEKNKKDETFSEL